MRKSPIFRPRIQTATIRQLWVRIQRMRLARWAFRLSRALRDIGEALTPEDLRTRL